MYCYISDLSSILEALEDISDFTIDYNFNIVINTVWYRT